MLASIKNQVWMIRPDMIPDFALAIMEVPSVTQSFEAEDMYPMRKNAEIDKAGIGHVEIKGALLNQSPRIYEKLGLVTTYQTIIDETKSIIRDGAKGVVFHINSPGGTVSGNVEAAKFIQNLPIPTVSHCVGMACSAAYKLACGAGAVFANYSAEVGNIGTILSWADCSEFWRDAGVEFKAMTNKGADLKSTFHLEPNSTQLAFLQDSLDETGCEFRSHVEQNMPGIDPEVFRAGWYSGERAAYLGLIHGIMDANEASEWLAGNLTKE